MLWLVALVQQGLAQDCPAHVSCLTGTSSIAWSLVFGQEAIPKPFVNPFTAHHQHHSCRQLQEAQLPHLHLFGNSSKAQGQQLWKVQDATPALDRLSAVAFPAFIWINTAETPHAWF